MGWGSSCGIGTGQPACGAWLRGARETHSPCKGGQAMARDGAAGAAWAPAVCLRLSSPREGDRQARGSEQEGSSHASLPPSLLTRVSGTPGAGLSKSIG